MAASTKRWSTAQFLLLIFSDYVAILQGGNVLIFERLQQRQIMALKEGSRESSRETAL